MKQLHFILFLVFFGIANLSCKAQPAKTDTIKAADILKTISEGKPIFCSNAIVTGDLDFTTLSGKTLEAVGYSRIRISQPIVFIDCIFMGKVVAFSVGESSSITALAFEKNLSVIRSEFKEEAVFNEIIVNGLAYFSGTKFDKTASFEGAYFDTKNTFFSETTFFTEARFQRACFVGDANFLKVAFDGITSFQKAVFRGEAQFGTSKFAQYADFGSVRMYGACFFNGTEFANKLIFNQSVLSGRIEFQQAKFQNFTEFKNVMFNGWTKFNDATFAGSISFENSVFMLGKPETKKIVKAKDVKFDFSNATFLEQKALQGSDF